MNHLFISLLVASLARAAPHSSESWSSEAWPSTWSWSGYGSHSARPTSTTPVPTSSSTTIPTTTTTNEYACATVSSLVAGATAAIPTIPAQIAWDCLQSVPLNATAGVPWIQSLIPYIYWQTTTAYLKNPPSGYLEPAVDVYGTIDQIISNLQKGGVYSNEYDLEYELYHLFQSTHDGHFRYLPTLVAGVLTFGRPLALVSVSSDGHALPKPYVYSDILLGVNDTTFTPSAVTEINGEDATSYLEAWAQFGSLQDPDALYNNVFYELAQISLGSTGTGAGTFAGGGRGAYIYPNATTVLGFENGTTATFENFAQVLQSFNGIQTGQDVYDKYLVQPPFPSTTATSSSSASSTAAPTPTGTPAPGYPPPVIRQENNLIGGYYLDGAGYEDVAILSVPSFVGLFTEEQSFQQVALDFISQSKTDGKTKLVVDVSANGGGTILQGYSLFTNLFPDIQPYGATRFRAHEAFNIMGEEVSAVAGPVYPWNYSDPSPYVQDYLDNFLGVPFDYRADVDVNYENFQSWAQKYGPHEYYGDNFTSIIRWNLSDPTTILTSGIIVNGYQNRTNIVPARPFAAEDIIVLYDGYCASTCTIFSEFMTAQAGVKTIAVGGRPAPGITQAVGGVKGTNDYGWAEIYALVNSTFELGTPAQQAAWQATELGAYGLLPFTRSADMSGYVNARDGIRQGDATETPLQFVYQAADCRLFYTPEMTVDVTALWKTAVDSTWGGKDSCVAGSVAVNKGKPGQRPARAVQKHAARPLDAAELAALQDSLHTWTDLRGQVVVGDGYMLP